MATVTTGLFFVARQSPAVDALPDGTFRLSLRVVDNQGPGRVEPYLVAWCGNAAKAWWAEHESHLRAGQPLKMELANPRSFHGLRSPETHATVLRCELAPLARNCSRREDEACPRE